MSGRLFDVKEFPEVPLFREPRRSRGEHDARFRNDYPPEWDRCVRCSGTGKTDAGEGDGWPAEACLDCLGMGSLKARVRFEAGHRCERCRHPYVPKGDAKMLGVEPSPFHWSPCDEGCVHRGPVRVREAAFGDEGPWVEADLDRQDSRTAGEVRLDEGMYGLTVRYDVEAEWRILTVHHLDGDKANCRWWNLAALCQRCHLEIQAKVVMERIYPHEHSAWFKPYACGYYAWVYESREVTRKEAAGRADELLAYERIV